MDNMLDSMQVDLLTELLREKGVPSGPAEERCRTVISRLGNQQAQAILKHKNPWAELKAAASKPGTMFRLVTPGELREYVQQRASTRHGAQIKNHKGKKPSKLAPRQQPLQLDPDQFELDSLYFKDDDDLAVEQLDFTDVGAEARGVALCTSAMAKHFLDQPMSISTEALALLIIDTIPEDIIKSVGLKPIIIPAKFKGTEEHTLIYGHILQLGDNDVTRENASKDSCPDVIDTKVVKIQVYRDQFAQDWHRFTSAPIRALVAMIEALQLCAGSGCGNNCPRFHPAVDEQIDNVIFEIWARSFFDEQGRKAEPHQATVFTAFFRIPEGALNKLLATAPSGVYFEPRGTQPREHDDAYRVIWLPGVDFDGAVHHCRTFDRAICLTRMRNKYGIRVKREDESAAWAHLRPGTTFTPMTVQHIFELFPIPHGTQRHAIVKLLADWGWIARPLQPGKGSFDHMAWRVGAPTPPPHAVMTGFKNDIIITQIKEKKHTSVPVELVNF